MVGLSSGMLLLYSVGAVIGPLAAGPIFGVLDGGGLFLFAAVVAIATVLFGLWRMREVPAAAAAEQVSFVAVPRTSPAGVELDPRQEETEPGFDFKT